MPDDPTFVEFFCGGGMVRAGLGSEWVCQLANDIDARKCAIYRANWGPADLVEGDVAALDPQLLTRQIDLYWASSPCQDFSLAGKGAGLDGQRSGTFHAWYDLISGAVRNGFGPQIIAFENVTGLLSRRGGADFRHIFRAFVTIGYRVGAMVLDASLFLPQSRPRVFVVAVRGDVEIPAGLTTVCPVPDFHTARLVSVLSELPQEEKRSLVWWAPPRPPHRKNDISDLVDLVEPLDGRFMRSSDTARLLSLMSPLHRARIDERVASGRCHVGTIYKRGRPDVSGKIVQRAEVRFDGLAGCLRTPGGGSSRQTLIIIDKGEVRTRLLTAREAVRLMGLPESFRLPASYNDAYKLAGDGVAVPIVRYLRDTLFLPIIANTAMSEAA